jgi:DNA mismatch repair ATPase MutL
VIYQSDNEPEPWLIDLQLGDKLIRERAFIEAFESNTIKSRPILVPIRLSVTPSSIACLEHYQSMLTQFGFTLDRHHEQLTVRAIPTLFTQIDVISFVNELLNYLTDNAPDQSALCDYLQQQLPLLPITSMEQAETILKQLPRAEAGLPWCRQLDKELLSSLF